MKILVTGAKGMLGSDIIKTLSSCPPLPTGERQGSHCCEALQWEAVRGASRADFDITDYSQTIDYLKDKKPDIVVHSAAYTKVDDCESNKETALNVNANGTKNVALGCKEINAKLIYISTDYVFDGKKNTPYLEDDIPNPLSVYGDSKLKGEQAVQDILKDFIIIRTSWLFGKNGNNFISAILRQTGKNKIIKVVNDQKGSPTYTVDLAGAIERLISFNAKGIFNITNSGNCTWYQFAKKILECAGLKRVEVVPITSKEFNRPARRPAYSVLDCSKFKNIANYQMRHWEDALKDYLYI